MKPSIIAITFAFGLLPLAAQAQQLGGYGLNDVQPSQSIVITPESADDDTSAQDGGEGGFSSLKEKMEAMRLSQQKQVQDSNEELTRRQLEMLTNQPQGTVGQQGQTYPENPAAPEASADAPPPDTTLGGLLTPDPAQDNGGGEDGNNTMGGLLAP